MPIEKEFGKLTHSQFAELVTQLPELRGQMHDLPCLLRQKKDRLTEILGSHSYSWGQIYERPFLEQMAWLFILLGLDTSLRGLAQFDDPQAVALRCGDEGGMLDRWYDENADLIDRKHLLWLGIVLQRNILAIMLYHRSMGSLVEEVRQGNDASLFQAVRVDRSVLLAQPCSDRLSRAEMTNDQDFFRHLRSAFKGPTQRHMAAIQDLRYSIVALFACGFDQFSDIDLERLFIQTRLYPNSAGALKNLRKHIFEARKFSTTLKRDFRWSA